ncbi:OprD family outer membrane porin [Sulfurovum sp.]|uniref:OprD family outer membrane porin n=1 Tax=Sulfurovum sp. TaxID=1969726 RepID=UPI0025F358D7|nr:OprD family outer membrane porin [Sulfurovum sp.]
MKQILLGAILLMIMSIDTYGEVLDRNKENNTTVLSPDQIKVKTVRNVLGMNNPLEHTTGQLRTGYITHKEDGSKRNSGYALGGHYHLDTKRWNGLKVGLSAYTVLNLGVNQNPLNVNPDFFDADGNSFIQLTEAYLDGKWGNTEIKLGRQLLDTPHADSDDIRMIPNYFEAYTLRNNDIEGLTLSAGLITKMAGWENGVDAAKFVKVSETLGAGGGMNGIAYASAIYEGINDLTLSLWYYHYNNVADVLYAEAGYVYAFSQERSLTFGLQYDGSSKTGSALLGEQDGRTYGMSLEFAAEDIGIHLLTAYNRDGGNTGATGLSLGGGPFFTSMENQTLDAVGSAGSAWMIGAGYHFDVIGINGLVAGIAYGNFQARDSGLYESHETDTVFEYAWSDKLSLTAAFASVRFDAGKDGDNTALKNFKQFRFIVNYNFN